MKAVSRMVTRGGLAAAVVGSLTLAAGALGATKTITVSDHESIPKCQDIDQVVADAGTKTTKFTITMAGQATAKPCQGGSPPYVIINQRCNVSSYKGQASVACEGGGGGPATISVSPSDPHDWIVKFATKEAQLKGTTSFQFEVYLSNQDTAGPATVKIG